MQLTPSGVIFLDVLAAVLGLFIGSFLNVGIYRIPRRKSIVYPPSHCPRCKAPIKPYDNIPVLSYLLLRGKCRKCGQPISGRYPLVELLTAALFLLLAIRFGLSWELARGLVFTGILILISFIDLDLQVIPDAVVIPGVAVGLLSSLLIPRAFGQALIGAAVGVLIIWGSGALWRLATRRAGMGGGDVVLAAMMGAFLGWQGNLLAIFAGVLLGVFIGGGLGVFRKRNLNKPIPFGPFLALGSLVALFFGAAILRWYGQLFRR